MRLAQALLLAMVISCKAFATAQAPDKITLNGETLSLQTNPLSGYLEEINWQPAEDIAMSSANWRGYIASWSIVADKLILDDVTVTKHEQQDGKSRYHRVSIIGELFAVDKDKIATWYSGALIIPFGKQLEYVHMGYGSVYEQYYIVRVKQGIVIELLSLDAEQFDRYKQTKFLQFKQTDEYQNMLRELTTGDDAWPQAEADGFMMSFYAEQYLSVEQ